MARHASAPPRGDEPRDQTASGCHRWLRSADVQLAGLGPQARGGDLVRRAAASILLVRGQGLAGVAVAGFAAPGEQLVGPPVPLAGAGAVGLHAPSGLEIIGELAARIAVPGGAFLRLRLV